jgi:hypothetical protein
LPTQRQDSLIQRQAIHKVGRGNRWGCAFQRSRGDEARARRPPRAIARPSRQLARLGRYYATRSNTIPSLLRSSFVRQPSRKILCGTCTGEPQPLASSRVGRRHASHGHGFIPNVDHGVKVRLCIDRPWAPRTSSLDCHSLNVIHQARLAPEKQGIVIAMLVETCLIQNDVPVQAW